MLKRLSVRGKLFVLVAIPGVAFLVLAIAAVRDASRTTTQMGTLGETVVVAERAGGLLYESQKERGMSAGYLGSKGTQFADAIVKQRQSFDEALSRLRPVLDTANDTSELGRQLLDIREYVTRVPGMRKKVTDQLVTVKEAVPFYTKLNRKLLAVVDMVAKRAARPDVAAMATALGGVMRVTEYGGIERAVLANTYARGRFGPGMWNRLQQLIALQNENEYLFQTYASEQLRASWAEQLSEEVVGPTEQMRKVALASKGTGPVEGYSATDWFGAQTAKLDRLRAVQLSAIEALQTAASGHRQVAFGAQMGLMTLAFLAIGLTLWVGWRLVSGITNPLNELANVMTEAEQKAEFSQRVSAAGSDELALAGRAFNGLLDQLEATIEDVEQMCTAMGRGHFAVAPRETARGRFRVITEGLLNVQRIVRNVISEVNSTVGRLESSVEQITGSSTLLATNAEELSTITTSSMAATEQTDAMVAANTDGVQKAGERVTATSERAEGGREKMDELQEAISAIAEVSRELSDSIKSIDGIAFQTNILAVNAAIEAAAAGRHGRGFAVVAQEVQNLAERAAEAAKDSASHLEETRSSVEDGLRVATATAESFKVITSDVVHIGDILQEIASASREQRIGVSELSRSMQEINKSASMLHKESGGLSGQATSLTEMIAALREALAVFDLSESSAVSATERSVEAQAKEGTVSPAVLEQTEFGRSSAEAR